MDMSDVEPARNQARVDSRLRVNSIQIRHGANVTIEAERHDGDLSIITFRRGN